MDAKNSVRTRVRNGVKWLNKCKPGWRKMIDPANLRMANHKFCVIGQLFGGYFNKFTTSNSSVAVKLGFQAPSRIVRDDGYYDRLHNAWIGELRTR